MANKPENVTPPEEYYLGLDVSTQGTKLVVIDFYNKNVAYITSLNYDKDLPHYNTHNGTIKNRGFGVSESDPHMWIEAIEVLFTRLKKEKGELIKHIRGIGVSGQQHGLVALTKEGELARPYSKLWNDFSTGEECEILTEAIGGKDKMIAAIANTQRPGYTASKIFHMLRHEPENYKKTAVFLLVHNYINWYLTGGKEGGIAVMEPGDASGTALWNPISKQWNKQLVSLISEDLLDKLPPVKPSREPVGKIGKNLVEKFGFSEDTIISSGSGDNMMAAIGTGNYKEGRVTVSLGTSGTAYTFMREPYVDKEGEIATFCDATGNYLPLLCISNLANGYEAILEQYSITHDQFIELAEKIEPTNEGRVLIPWFEGERTPDLPEAAPLYFGFSFSDFTREKLCRAVLEGHIMNLYEGFIKLPVKAKEIRLTGGISQSRIWRETIANIFNCEVVRVLGEGAALGAALHAAWTVHTELTIEEVADPFIQLDEDTRITPNPEIVEKYNDFKSLYISLSHRIRGLKGENPFRIYKQLKINKSES